MSTSVELLQGDSLRLSVVGPRDMTSLVTAARAVAYHEGQTMASGLAADLTIKVDDTTANWLKKVEDELGSGILARVGGEWVTITAIAGSLVTVTRGATDPAGNASVAADFDAGEDFVVVPMSVAATATLDPADATNQTVNVSVAPTETMIPPNSYDLQVAFQDDPTTPTDRWTYIGKMVVVGSDADKMGF